MRGTNVKLGALAAAALAAVAIAVPSAPTILWLLGLDPNDLEAVQLERTEVLPGT